jgi:hypothetical protein
MLLGDYDNAAVDRRRDFRVRRSSGIQIDQPYPDRYCSKCWLCPQF